MKKISIVVFALIFSFAPALRASAISIDSASIAQTLLELTNTERRNAQRSNLTLNPLLVKAAQAKAADMLAKGYFDHTSPTGKQFFKWIDDTGYAYTFAGENLAANIYTISPEKMVESWMNSPGHHDNLMSTEYTETGIGVVSGTYEGKGTVFAVQIFTRPKDASNFSTVVPVQTPVPGGTASVSASVVTTGTIVKSSVAKASSSPVVKKSMDKVETITVQRKTEKAATSTPIVALAAQSLPILASTPTPSSSPSVWTTLIHKVVNFMYALFR